MAMPRTNLPSIYILRKPSEPLPNYTDCKAGDVVILHSGDLMVHEGTMWYLLPGRYLDTDQLKVFVRYVASGWPTEPEMIRQDLIELGDKRFLDEMTTVARKVVLATQQTTESLAEN